MKILLSGAAGRMGRAVAKRAAELGVEIAAGVDAQACELPFPCHRSFAGVTEQADAIIDFSRPEVLPELLAWATAHHVPAVLATTGYTGAQLREIDRAAQVIPVFRSANMSLGVAVLRLLAMKAAKALGEDFDIEIVEAHHNQKADAPSGTALALRDAICSVRPLRTVYGREGRQAKRSPDEIGVHALRGGTVAGEHEICFFGPMERIRLSHSAENREVFAAGALRAADFLRGVGPGLYSMDDMLEIIM